MFNLLGPPITIFFTARWEARKNPGLNVTPKPLTDYSVSGAPGTPMSYFGYEFEVPWKTSFKKKGGTGKNGIVQFDFESGQVVVFIVPGNYSGLLTEIVDDQSLNMKNLRLVFGDLMDRSPYDQYATLLNTTPQSIRAFGSRAEAVRGVTLLTIKAIAIPSPGLGAGAFSFELHDKHGFQIGDPRNSKSEVLEVFGMDYHYVEILCTTSKDNTGLSQPELNRILRSLHPILTESSPIQPRQSENGGINQ
jgi:hypothetical protein